MSVELLGGTVTVLIVVDPVGASQVGFLPGGEVVLASGEMGEYINTKTSVVVIVREGLEESS